MAKAFNKILLSNKHLEVLLTYKLKIKSIAKRLLYKIAEWEGSIIELHNQPPSWTAQLIKIVRIAIFHEEITENSKIHCLLQNHEK